MKKPRPTTRSLIFLFTVSVFFTLLITIVIFGGIMLVLAESGRLSNRGLATKVFPIVVSAAATLALGTLCSIFLVRIPLRPIRRLIEGLRRLADGHFEERVDLGDAAIYQELSESFNTLACELQNTEVLRSDFVNNFSHEFKTPIVSIQGFARILKRGDLPEDERQEFLDIIVDESTRLSTMATNVLNLTKIENQNILTDVTEYNLSEQIRKCILMQEKKWSQKKLQIVAEFSEHMIRANMSMLNQVWINLLDNAVKFSPEGGEVNVSLNNSEDGVLVSIANQGPEITPEQKKRIYDKFWQGDTSHAAEGTGIGLSIVKKIVELHGGTVDVTSSPEETVFSVYLPHGVLQE